MAMAAGQNPIPRLTSDSSGIIRPNIATEGMVMITEAMYKMASASFLSLVMRIPMGTPVRIATPTDMLTR